MQKMEDVMEANNSKMTSHDVSEHFREELAHTETSGSSHMMMKMYFHGGYDEVILFDFWRINTVGGLVGSMFACFFMAVLYEAIKVWSAGRYWKKKRTYENCQLTQDTQILGVERTSSSGVASGDAAERRAEDNEMSDSPQTSSNQVQTQDCSWRLMFSKDHVILSCLHLLQLVVAYMLMLIVMTYNTWLCLAVVSGATVGYFLLNWKRHVLLEESGDCGH